MAFDVAERMAYQIRMALNEPAGEEEKEEAKEEVKEEVILDGVPESFIGPQLYHLVAHEVGHTLGLQPISKRLPLTVDEINTAAIR